MGKGDVTRARGREPNKDAGSSNGASESCPLEARRATHDFQWKEREALHETQAAHDFATRQPARTDDRRQLLINISIVRHLAEDALSV